MQVDIILGRLKPDNLPLKYADNAGDPKMQDQIEPIYRSSE